MKRKKYLIYFIGNLHNGGGQRQLYLRLKYHDRENYHIRVACLRSRENSHKYTRKIEGLGIGVDFLEIHLIAGFAARVKCLKRYLVQEKPDIVESYLHFAYTTANLAACLARVPLIVTFLDNLPNPQMKKERPFEYRLAMHALKDYCDHAIACSQRVKDAFARESGVSPEKITVLTNTVDVGYWSENSKKSARPAFFKLRQGNQAVGCVGRLSRQKGIPDLVRAAYVVVKNEPGTHFYVAGDGDQKEEIRKLVEELGLNQNFHIFDGDISMRQFYQGLDVFCLASHWEGLPLSLLEAMSSHVPVVVTSVGGNAEVVKHGVNGFLVSPGKPEELALKISELLNNQELATSFIKKGYETVTEKFDQKKQAGELISLYQTHFKEKFMQDRFERGIIIRACSWPAFISMYHDVQQRMPWLKLSVLTQQGTEQKLLDELRLNAEDIISYGKGEFRFRQLGLSRFLRLRRLNFQVMVIGYNNPLGRGYWRFELLSRLIGVRRVTAYRAWLNVRVGIWPAYIPFRRLIRMLWQGFQVFADSVNDFLIIRRGIFSSRRRRENAQ